MMAAPVSPLFWLLCFTVGGSGGASSIFSLQSLVQKEKEDWVGSDGVLWGDSVGALLLSVVEKTKKKGCITEKAHENLPRQDRVENSQANFLVSVGI